MSSSRKILEGLQDAVRGNLIRVTIQGQVWVRQDVELTTRVDILEAENRLLKKRLADAQKIIHRRKAQ